MLDARGKAGVIMGNCAEQTEGPEVEVCTKYSVWIEANG